MEEKLKLTVSEVLYQKYQQESDNFLFCRVPKSEGKRFIRFATDSMKPNVSNNGMIVSINPLEEYTLLDKSGTQVEKIQGVDLYNSYYEYLPFLDGERRNADKKTLEEEIKIAEENKKVIARITEQQKKSMEAAKTNPQTKQKSAEEQKQDVSTVKPLPESTNAPTEEVRKVYTQEQFNEIRKGIRNGVDVSKYKSINLNHLQMKEIRLGLESGIDVSAYNDHKFNANQMKEMRMGLSKSFDMKKYRGFTGEQLREIRLGLDRNLDVTKYANKRFHPEQMKLIRTGMQAGLDVALYNNPRFDISMMKKIQMDLMMKRIMDRIKEMFYHIKDRIADLIDEAKTSQIRKAVLMREVDAGVNEEIGGVAKFVTELIKDAEMISEEQSEEVQETIEENLKEKYEQVTEKQEPALTKEEVQKMIDAAVKEVLAKETVAEKVVTEETIAKTEKSDLSVEPQKKVRRLDEFLRELEKYEEAERMGLTDIPETTSEQSESDTYQEPK